MFMRRNWKHNRVSCTYPACVLVDRWRRWLRGVIWSSEGSSCGAANVPGSRHCLSQLSPPPSLIHCCSHSHVLASRSSVCDLLFLLFVWFDFLLTPYLFLFFCWIRIVLLDLYCTFYPFIWFILYFLSFFSRAIYHMDMHSCNIAYSCVVLSLGPWRRRVVSASSSVHVEEDFRRRRGSAVRMKSCVVDGALLRARLVAPREQACYSCCCYWSSPVLVAFVPNEHVGVIPCGGKWFCALNLLFFSLFVSNGSWDVF